MLIYHSTLSHFPFNPSYWLYLIFFLKHIELVILWFHLDFHAGMYFFCVGVEEQRVLLPDRYWIPVQGSHCAKATQKKYSSTWKLQFALISLSVGYIKQMTPINRCEKTEITEYSFILLHSKCISMANTHNQQALLSVTLLITI